MDEILAIGKASKYVGVTVHTMQTWDREGKLTAHRTPTNKRYYYKSELDRYLGKADTAKRKVIAYARVSSSGQKHDLQDQLDFLMQYCNAKGIIVDEYISEIGSGLNYKRKKWNKLLDQVDNNEISTIYVTYKDRFVRFGFEWFEQFCQKHNTKIVIVNNPKTSPDQELVEDLISVIHVFSCRLYGLRRYTKKIRQDKNLKGDEEKNDKGKDDHENESS